MEVSDGCEADVEMVGVLGKDKEAMHKVHKVEDEEVEGRAEKLVDHVKGKLTQAFVGGGGGEREDSKHGLPP